MAQPEQQQQDEGIAGGVSGFAKNASVLARVPGFIGSVGGIFAKTATNSIPFIGSKIGGQTAGQAITGAVGESVGNIGKFSGLDKVFAGVTFGAHAIEATGELMDGDVVGATGKLVKGSVNAAGLLFTFSGIGLAVDVASLVFTKDTVAGHLGKAAEKATTSLLGGTKEERDARGDNQIRETKPGIPAAAVVVPAGIAATGLVANKMMSGNGKPLTVGSLPGNRSPKGKPLSPIPLDGEQILPTQVMEVEYSPERSITQEQNNATLTQQDQLKVEQQQEAQPAPGKTATFWQEKIAAEKGGRQLSQAAGRPVSGDGRFADAVLAAREYASDQQLTHAV